ncbi:hypothetical protein ACH4TE_35615 [Streptomyces sioyaensis]|uniref:hypothetical protein n=1 Tax=Streptomyces sioyaensis TaxID=67364 RepID=UPI00379C3924
MLLPEPRGWPRRPCGRLRRDHLLPAPAGMFPGRQRRKLPKSDCHFESICESCTFFVTTIEFRPTLERQRDDATAKGQVAREQIFDGLLSRLDGEAS